jgi:hypothetical protein
VCSSDLPQIPDKYQKFFKRCPWVQNKADLIKWVILQDEGGWVMDTDTVPVTPLSGIYDEIGKSDFVGIEYSRDINSVDVGFIGATREARFWKPINDFLTINVPVDFARRNASGFQCFNYARKQIPEALKILPREVYCPTSRSDRAMVNYSKDFLRTFMRGDDVIKYIETYVQRFNRMPYGWHIWMTGSNKL